MNRLSRNFIALGVFVVIAAVAPVALKSWFGQLSVSYLAISTNALKLAILALSWDILARTGQLSLAHAAFFGAGGYTAAIIFKMFAWPMWIGIVFGAVVASLLAWALGAVTLRLYGIYFAIATLSFTEVLKVIVQKLPQNVAGGAAGMNIPALFRPQFIAGEMQRWEVAFIRNQHYFWVYAGVLAVAIFISIILMNSRLRGAFTAVRTNEIVASVMGVNPARMKILAFVLSSFIVGLLGAVEAHRYGNVFPDGAFNVATTVTALVTPIFGGLYTTVGPILGAFSLSGIEEFLKRTFSDGYMIGYGVVLVLTILLMPGGLISLQRLFRRDKATPDTVAEPAVHNTKPPTIGDEILTVTGLTKNFGGLQAVRDVSFSVREGEIFAIIGPNGAGKSTTLDLVSGILTPTAGSVQLLGEDITGAPSFYRCHLGLGRAFQVVQPFQEMTVRENIFVAAEFGTQDAQTGQHIGAEQSNALAERAIRLSGLTAIADRPVADLNLLQEKRLEIARALATNPRILLLDEVMAGLRPNEARQAVELLKGIRADGVTIVFIEHVMDVVRDLADRVLVMDHGAEIAAGSYRDVTADERVIEAYLGREE